MSATTSTTATSPEAPKERPSGSASSDPLALRVVEFVVSAGVVGILAWSLFAHWPTVRGLLPDVLPWLVVVAIADLMPVPIWRSVELMTSFPILLAAAFIFPPYVAGALSFAGTFDTRELRREISAGRALLNRSNVALSVMAAGWVFRAMGGDVLEWPRVLPITLVSLLVDSIINATLVVIGARLLTGIAPGRLVQRALGGSHPIAFMGGYICFGLLAVVLATVYRAAGAWGLVAFAVPVFLARQMFVHWKSLAETEHRLDANRKLLKQVSSQIADERRDERLAVAAGLHDEVLPPLYKVHLMGQVLRQDLASGRLLDLEADLPDLLQATEAASNGLRDLVGDLRRSTLGPGGLVQSLERLARKVADETGVHVVVRSTQVRGTPLTHLLVYQVAREALTNAIRHSGADRIQLILEDGGDELHLVVEDNGNGFDLGLVDGDQHFGLQLMRERVELAGGGFHVEASPRTGTRVIASVPVARRPVEHQ